VDAGGKIPTTAQQVDTITKRSKDDAVCTEACVRAAEVRFFSVIWVRISAYIIVIFMVFYLFTRLAGCSVDPEISCGACKLARTPRVTKQKKKMMPFVLLDG
jgi:hypothetical protein